MNIDFAKLITLLLPTFMRTGLTSLISTISAQFTSLYAVFQLWQYDIRLQAAMTCQVMYLETILNYRLLGSFLRTIYISDGDGVIVDFVINVPPGLNIDNYRMIALIEKYKIAGKRYTIAQSAYTYNVEWSGFQCEKANREFSVQWTGPVCELEEVADLVNNLITLNLTYSALNIADGTMSVSSQYNVTSELTIEVRCVLDNETKSEILVIPYGSNSSQEITFSYPTEILISGVYSINPVSDSTYNYIY